MGPDTLPPAEDLFQQRHEQMLREKAHVCVWNTNAHSSLGAPAHPQKAQHALERKVPAGEACFLLFNSNLSACFDHGILFPQNTYELAEYRFPGA